MTRTQPSPAKPADFLGYIAEFAHARWDWHADPACPELAEDVQRVQRQIRERDVDTVAAPSALALTADQAASCQDNSGRRPCPVCAFGPVLSELAAGVPGRGYHALVCRAFHGPRPAGWNPMTGCAVCAALCAHAAAGTHLVSLAGGRAALLGPGQLPDQHLELLAGMRLVTENAEGAGLAGQPGADLWEAAAGLMDGQGTPLEHALAAAAALYDDQRATGRTAPRPPRQ